MSGNKREEKIPFIDKHPGKKWVTFSEIASKIGSMKPHTNMWTIGLNVVVELDVPWSEG